MSDEPTDPAFEELLAYLRQHRGFDFTGYKRASLERRVGKRMQAVGVPSFAEYIDFLEVHPDEFTHLFNTILINVTGFFRDPPVWDFLRAEVVPQVLAAHPAGQPVRVWSAGCASGEEAYSLAVLFAEALGPDTFRERVKVYGTDVDEEALAQARLGAYPAKALGETPAELQEKYFEPVGEKRAFRKDLRRNVIFGRHDLIQDAPISRLDLLVCRNCLMYFNAETQARILERFHFAVCDTGFLVLGKAEMLFGNGNSFAPVDLKRRVFRKVPRPGGSRPRLWATAAGNGNGGGVGPLVNHVRIREAALDAGPVPQVVVDATGLLALANQEARSLFALAAGEVGRPFNELDVSTRPCDLRAAMQQVRADGRPAVVRGVEWLKPSGEVEYLDVQVVPLPDPGAAGLLGVSVTFTPVTQARRLQDELRRSNEELESAYEELQSSSEELETTNEELQSTVEELETTNEELQSTNEELETMNEELQSANEELQTMNTELRERGDELAQVNLFLEAILASFAGGVAVLDRDLMVLVWTHRAEDLWGLRPEEVRGHNFLNLDIGLPVGELRQQLRDGLAGKAVPPVTLAAVNRRGKSIRCQVTCTPLAAFGDDPRGVILHMEDVTTEEATT